jgi:hypothetical protein
METTSHNSAFVNVTLSITKINGKYPLYDLKRVSAGDWVMTEEAASTIKYLFPVKANEVLRVFEVESFIRNNDGRVRFKLKNIYQGSLRLMNEAHEEAQRTNYVVKYFNINENI